MPESSGMVKDVWTNYKSTPKLAYIKSVNRMISPHIDKVRQYDQVLLSRDYKYAGGETVGDLVILPGLNMCELNEFLNEIYTTDENRTNNITSIYDYVYALYLNSGQALNQIDGLGDSVNKFKEILKSMVTDAESEKNIASILESGVLDEGNNGETIEESLNKIKDMLGESSVLTTLLIDIVSDLGITNATSPADLITGVLSSGEPPEVIFGRIIEKVKSKFVDGDIPINTIIKELMVIQKKVMTDNPMCKKLLSTLTGLKKDDYDILETILNKTQEEMTESDKATIESIMNKISSDGGGKDIIEMLKKYTDGVEESKASDMCE